MESYQGRITFLKTRFHQNLQSIVFDKTILKDMAHLAKFTHTGVLEVYHSVLNEWTPKNTHFPYKEMVARFKLAAIDFNQSQKLDQAKTMSGNKRYSVYFSKVTKSWAAKPIKEQKVWPCFLN